MRLRGSQTRVNSLAPGLKLRRNQVALASHVVAGIDRHFRSPRIPDSRAAFLESCGGGVPRPPTEAAYLANQRTAANAAVIAVEMRRPSAAALNQSQTDKPGLRGGITPLSSNNIVGTGKSQSWATGGRVRKYRLLDRYQIGHYEDQIMPLPRKQASAGKPGARKPNPHQPPS